MGKTTFETILWGWVKIVKNIPGTIKGHGQILHSKIIPLEQ